MDAKLLAERKKTRIFYGYTIVGAAFLSLLVMAGTIYCYGVFFKPLTTEFGWTRAVTSGAYSLNMILLGLFGIIAGRLNDKLGPRIIVTGTGFSLGLGYILMSRISSVWQLYLVYGLVLGLGECGWIPLLSTVARWFRKRIGLMTGIALAGSSLGQVIMPPVASRLISLYGWRHSFIIIGIIAMVLLVLAAQLLKRDPGKMGQLPDGAVGTEPTTTASEKVGFSLQEAMRTRQFWLFCGMALCVGFALQSIMVHVVPHATDMGIPPLVAASILSFVGIGGIAGRIFIGGASDRIGSKASLLLVFILLSATLLWLGFIEQVWMLFLFGVIFGFGYGGLAVTVSPMVAELFGLGAHGVILGVTTFVREIGEAAGPVIAGRLFDIMGNYQIAFLLCAILSIAGLLLVLQLKPLHRDGWQKTK